MKTFENEFEELFARFTEKTKAFQEELAALPVVGRDTLVECKRYEDVQEYNRQLVELKIKYGKPFNQQEEEIRRRHNL